jgi:micrococcal nuclease
MDTTDPEGDNPGEPEFNVLANGESLAVSGRVENTDNGSFTANVPESSLESYGRGDIRLKVQLVDDDPGLENQVIQARQFTVSFEPTTTTATATPTATATQKTAAPTEATETSESESGSPGEEGRRATVTRVIDGDTVEVQFEDGKTDTVRLLGVDTPETTLSDVDPSEYEDIPDSTAGRDHLFNWGERASDYATDELDGETVRVVTDPESDRRGSFDRLLAYIYVDGENFNLELIEQGYARMYDSSFSQRSEFDSAEEEARSENEGLWDFDGSTSTETETATPTDELSDDSDGSSDLPPPSGGSSDPYDCPDFDTKQQAQEYFESNNPDDDPSGLDRDDDGEACDSGVD